jgi:hypothetical protein
MNIKVNSWHYKVYCWFLGYEPSQANLCPYVRTVFLWAPLKFLFTGWIWKVPFAALFWPPLLFEIPRWVGMVSYNAKETIYIIYSIFGAIASFCLLIAGVCYLWCEVLDLDHPFEIIGRAVGRSARTVASTKISTVVRAYVKALHDKVCPIIRFD